MNEQVKWFVLPRLFGAVCAVGLGIALLVTDRIWLGLMLLLIGLVGSALHTWDSIDHNRQDKRRWLKQRQRELRDLQR